MTDLKIPRLCLVVLVGVSGSGKSSFAARHFRPTEVLSSDTFRGLVGDDENDQSVTAAAFTALHAVAAERLKLGRLTVIDATNVQPDARRPLLDLAREHHVLPVAIVLDVPEQVCVQRNRARPDRAFGAGVVRRQHAALARSAAAAGARGVPPGVPAARRGRGGRGADRPGARLGRQVGPARAVRHHRRRARLPCGTGQPAGPARLPAGRGRVPAATRPGAPRCSSATWSTADRTRRACCAR